MAEALLLALAALGALASVAAPAWRVAPASRVAAEGPRLSLHRGRERHVFAPSVEGRTLEHVFELVSDGTEDVVILKVTPSCRCTKPRLVRVGEDGSRAPYVLGEALPPGARLDVEVRISTEKRPGKWTSHVVLQTNVPGPALELLCDAEVEGVFTVEPSLVVYGPLIAPGVEQSGELRISSEHLEPYLLAFEPEEEDAGLAVELEPVEPDEAGRARTWIVRYHLGPDLPEGLVAHPISLVSDVVVPLPKRPRPDGRPTVLGVEPIVYTSVEPALSFTPRFLGFGRVVAGTTVERVLRIEAMDGHPLAPTPRVRWDVTKPRSDLGADLLEVRASSVEGRPEVLELHVVLHAPPETAGSLQGFLTVVLDHRAAPRLRVPFGGVLVR